MDWNWKDKNNAARYNTLFSTPAQEFEACAAKLRLSSSDSLIDFGCGNGEFLATAMKTVSTAVGVDISEAQLAAAAERFKDNKRVHLQRTPFLDFKAAPGTFTRGFSRKALHHLDDAQKMEFFRGIGPYFRQGSLFLLEDGIFDFERTELEANWEKLMKDCAVYYAPDWEAKKDDVSFCFRQEFPAGIKAWTAAFEAGGFKVIERERRSSFYGSLLAEKR